MGETYALIPAAGLGERFRKAAISATAPSEEAPPAGDAASPAFSKLLLPLAGRPVLAHTLLAFERCPEIDGIVLVGSRDSWPLFQSIADEAGIRKPLILAEGGATRQESVAFGLDALPETAALVAIHDAARPLVTPKIIARTLDAARTHGAAVAGTPVTDTVKQVDAQGRVVHTPPRSELRAAQTPQTFRVRLIRRAHAHARETGLSATDDTALVEGLGEPVVVVVGARSNLKITTPEDLVLAEALLGEMRKWGNGEMNLSPSSPVTASSTHHLISPSPHLPIPPPRIGFGYDIHRLEAGRRLVLGGVEIPFERGLEGHSDADVLLHALMDALLGAAGLPDIGHLFPNTDERWRGVSSRVMLREVAARLREAGLKPSNVDMTLIAERPKISPYLAAMRREIAKDLGLPESAVGIKATTNERVGAVGREEAMAAQAVALLVQR